MGYKAKGKWEALGHGACRRRYGRPERERSYMTTPFSFGFLPTMLWDIKPRGNGRPWGMEPAVEDTDGRSVSDRTRPRFFSLAYAPPDPPTGVPASGIGYGFYQV